MLFNSFPFAAFFAAFLLLYWRLPHRARVALLLVGGYFFYACWDPRFLALLVISTVVDYSLGLWVDRLENPRTRKLAVGLSMAINLGFLGFFKYYGFFAANLAALLDRMGLGFPLPVLQVALPIGISFYTFQSMSYVVDVYRREVKPTRNLLEFATFVSYFPHLVAGPIMQPKTLLPQIEQPRVFSWSQFGEGAYLILWGLAKKLVVADNLARTVNTIWAAPGPLDGGIVWIGMVAFAFQIYGDFSGYTDIARGVSKCIGFELALNFNFPFFATSPRDFWSRWHISLSSWLRNYLYIPLGGSRGGVWRTYRNLALTMLLGGLWHGAGWTFLAWGAFQGALLVGHRLLEPWLVRVQPQHLFTQRLWKVTRILAFFHLQGLGWILFRSESIGQAGQLLSGFLRPSIPPWPVFAPVLAVILPLMLIEVIQYRARDQLVILRAPWPVRSAFYTATLYALILLGEFGGQQFIYFQF